MCTLLEDDQTDKDKQLLSELRELLMHVFDPTAKLPHNLHRLEISFRDISTCSLPTQGTHQRREPF